jgi:hypothetical protein
MAQISRPFQVVLAAFVLFAIAWFALLHRPGTSSSSGGGSAPASATPHPHAPAGTRTAAHTHAATPAPATAKTHSTTVTHHATGHAHSTTVTHRTTAHSGSTTVTHHSTSTTHNAPATHHVTVRHSSATHAASQAAAPGALHHAAVKPQGTRSAQRGPAAAAKSQATPPMQATVAAELKQGKVVLLLFWNPSSSNDVAVHRQVQIVAHKLGRGLAVHTASASQVGSFGSITRDIQVYQTPTLLIVNRHDQVTTVTGYTETYALEQAIREARG